MTARQQVQWRDVQALLQGQPAEQVLFAENAVLIGANQGGVIKIVQPGERVEDRIRPAPHPPQILPRQVTGFLDREQEQGQVGQALARRQIVDLHGADGTGKTSLISRTLHTQLPGAFPDGLVYLSARYETREDLLQALFDCFFVADEDVKVSANTVRRYMAGKRALIAVDDVNRLEKGEAEELAQAVPQCAVLISGRQHQVSQGTSVSLAGLPREQAVALYERHWGQLSAQDRPIVEAICAALQDIPEAIIDSARTAAARPVSLAEVLRQVQPPAEGPAAMGQAFWLVGSQLSAEERQVLGGLAAAGGATIGVEALPFITGLPADQIGQIVSSLQEMGLVQAHSPRYSLGDGLRPYIRQAWADEGMRSRAAEYYLGKAGQLQGRPKDPDEENVMAALGHYFRRKQWEVVVSIARAVEGYLVTAGRWGQWDKRLRNAWYAAREMGDRATEAWAQNQLGIVALSLGDTAAAIQLFRGALSIWQAVGDQVGITISRWNLQVLLAPPPPPPREGRPPDKPGGGSSVLPIVLGVTAAALAIVLGLLIWVIVSPPPPPPPPPPRSTTVAPPTTEIAPRVEVRLAGGCDQTYAPGGLLRIQIESSVDGMVSVYWVSSTGERDLLYQQPIQVGETASRDWDVPDEPGDWRLEADLNEGESRDRCSFHVETSAQAQVEIWLESGCQREYEPGMPVQILFRSSADGQVDIYLVSPDQEREPLFSEYVEAGQVASRDWEVAELAGNWALEAWLNGGQATGRCDFSVATESAPLEIVEIWIEPLTSDIGPTPPPDAQICPDDKVWVYVQVYAPDGISRVEIRARYPPGEGDWLPAGMFVVDAETYRHPLTAHESPGTEFYIYAEDLSGNSVQSDVEVYMVKPCPASLSSLGDMAPPDG